MKKVSVIFAIIFCVLLGGCKKQEAQPTQSAQTTASTKSSTPSTVETSSTTAEQVMTEPKASVKNLEEPLGTAAVFGEESEDAAHFVFKTDSDVKNFHFFKLDAVYDEENKKFVGNAAKEYGTLNALRAEEEVVLIGKTGEILPTLAVSFESQSGTIYYYAIEISGKDGQAMLTPFEMVG